METIAESILLIIMIFTMIAYTIRFFKAIINYVIRFFKSWYQDRKDTITIKEIENALMNDSNTS